MRYLRVSPESVPVTSAAARTGSGALTSATGRGFDGQARRGAAFASSGSTTDTGDNEGELVITGCASTLAGGGQATVGDSIAAIPH